MSAPITLYSTDGLMLARIGPVFVVLSRGAATSAGLAELEAQERKMGDQHVLLVVIEHVGAFQVDAAQRQRAVEMHKQLEGTRLAEAIVIESTGFVAAAVRALVVGIGVLGKGDQKVFKSVSEALAVLMPHVQKVDPGLSARAVETAIETLRKAPAGSPRPRPA